MAKSPITGPARAGNTQIQINCPISKQMLVSALWHCRNRLAAELNLVLADHCKPGADGIPDRGTMEGFGTYQVEELDREIAAIDRALSHSQVACVGMAA